MKSKLVNWKKDELIYEIGDKSDFAYLLVNGQIILTSSEDIRIGIIKADEIFGERSLLMSSKRSVNAKAFIDSSAIKISKEMLYAEFKKTPLIIQAILRSTFLRLDSANVIGDKIKDLNFE